VIGSCVSSQSQPHDVVEATGWPKMRAGVGKGTDAMTVTRGPVNQCSRYGILEPLAVHSLWVGEKGPFL
jgi:hypothetical protein